LAMFRLDYLSCFLTVVATILVGRKMWSGLVVSGVNSLIVCVIGLHTSQYGFIPANVFCICINAFNLRAWLSSGMVKGGGRSESTTDASGELVAGCKRVSTSRKAATRRLIKSFRIRSEGRRGNSISFLAVKGVWPFAPTPFALTQTSGCPTLDLVSSRQEWKSAISTVLSRLPAIRVISASPTIQDLVVRRAVGLNSYQVKWPCLRQLATRTLLGRLDLWISIGLRLEIPNKSRCCS
jgi:hypothetical protein